MLRPTTPESATMPPPNRERLAFFDSLVKIVSGTEDLPESQLIYDAIKLSKWSHGCATPDDIKEQEEKARMQEHAMRIHAARQLAKRTKAKANQCATQQQQHQNQNQERSKRKPQTSTPSPPATPEEIRANALPGDTADDGKSAGTTSSALAPVPVLIAGTIAIPAAVATETAAAAATDGIDGGAAMLVEPAPPSLTPPPVLPFTEPVGPTPAADDTASANVDAVDAASSDSTDSSATAGGDECAIPPLSDFSRPIMIPVGTNPIANSSALSTTPVDNRIPDFEFDLGEMPALGGSKAKGNTAKDNAKKKPMSFSYAAAMSAAPAPAPTTASGVATVTAAVFVK
jgi:hypothetical protein